ncbi:Ulp1 protease family, carboxy-terminal domain protein (macronuclear) [Tetrahymena thermophila SB210]|uniref:Ulp1 protease family, carboxy-terminal domain protein n=1 Tax=Tetrahymena thermophila (strain SB210) TaxID=312017 RepID=A4VDM3_TETTS|nr:Ulp1 protease family, carboxy-terminal domain protein [Tetrahymena thermophila SB210]EDK31630.1 Ulp1 protease family, carboxy-terminal domain protein [Tetrahymena thermophila SB210]|eukprot:XP_001471390.1 Ulp1 protease family, carboxy-terminal domain protein [Tetrahymena thermophila SB210]
MNQHNPKKNEDLPEFQEKLFNQTVAKPQIANKDKPKNIVQQSNQQNCQRGTKIMQFNKNQQNQSYLTSLIFKSAKIDSFSVELPSYDQQYSQLMGILDERTIGTNESVLKRTRNSKEELCTKFIQQISYMFDYKNEIIQKKNFLEEKSLRLFQKLFKVLESKINEIADTKKENEQKEKLEEKFENQLKQKNLKFYDEVYQLFKQTKQNDSQLGEQYQQVSSYPQENNQIQMRYADAQPNSQGINLMLGQRNNQQINAAVNQYHDMRMHEEQVSYNQMSTAAQLHSQDSAFMKGHSQNQQRGMMNQHNQMRMEEEHNFQNQMELNRGQNIDSQIKENIHIQQEEEIQNKVASNFSKDQIKFFYENVDVEKALQVYFMYQELQENLDQLNKDLKQNVEEKIYSKKGSINKLFEELKQRINRQICQLPINYFVLKQKEVFEYYQLPQYNETNCNIQAFEKYLAEQNKNIIAYQIKFSLEDLRRLTKDQLINDNLLDCYASYLRESHRNMKQQNQYVNKNDMSEIIIFSHLFFETQYESMRIKKDEAKAFMDQIYPTSQLFQPEFIDRFGFIVNVDLHGIKHWIFLGVYNKTREIIYYDSASSNNAYYKNISTALVTYFQQISGLQYTNKKADKCPRQTNGTDCGMFVLKYMQNFAYDTPQEFDQAHITELREKMYTFFPMLSYQKELKKIDYETLQYFEGRVKTRYDEIQPIISNNIKIC